ncbi:SurA N-terminal domain-containing protein [bacterium endosymbiont of Bathymodiolus sp. 5 South]|jgi:peptidyl-prolyl cis-trans isomerase D|uniref:SurA N-terminal domain-containing protein n=1 Tax=bacterium endosymbiont of Bathymodiolus sp. 5 South TaxID=1181670 RepID=UPI0010AFDF6F|nr:SurA N-terminal domain-containing protein [bacterium endosymbiont of Bathymodiolus sp. 5 South]CAC9660789.1 Peptidyl-prolyl cis-trans isomerase PpiD (EC 5.2.1.8) [uncultured Gammaproteobacteria bacterium]SHN89457.1 Peptidyl-prolyl cis-trans isomerase PpiD [bacterium endosymbiont of Bathymodiolus sp. 5 South]VVH54794.1 Peptidyl-prolyl cis-trans isomerase PpiD (EC [uncultured Gammaproteobacteria bacterium]VVH63477.1 Peptidyl-prolyl cis-trans isomerase PpiD (EC [uncultured Gammaproteobacteria b
MLSSIKDKTKGWVAYLIIALIAIPFALFGISKYFEGNINIVVANVGSDEISKEVYLKEFNRTKGRLQRELGKNYTAETDHQAKLSTIQLMVDRRVLTQLAEDSGYATTQRELQMSIQSNNAFKEEGKFSVGKYKALLKMNGLEDVEYERMKTDALMQNQIRFNILDSAFVTPSALKRMQSLNNQQRKFSYIRLNTKNYIDEVKVNPESVREFFDENKQAFLEPQKVKVDFIELSTKEIAKSIKVNDEELTGLYEEEQARFSTEEERKAQHILVKTEKLAKTIIAQLKAGESFAELAAKHSQDTGSKDKGGDLGFFAMGAMVPEFEAKVFAMKEGEVSSPVKTDFGYHVIKLNKIKAKEVKPFEALRSELTELYTEREVQKSIYKLTEQLSTLSYEVGLKETASQMALELKTSEFFTQDTKEYDAKFVAAAYSDEVLSKGESSKLIELSEDKFMVLRINEKIPQREKTFDEVKVEIDKHLSGLLAKTFIDNIANKITALLNEGDASTVKKLMDKYQLTWKEVGWVKRSSRKENTGIIKLVFSMPKPNDGVIYDAQSLNAQQSIVLKLSAIKTPDKTSDSASNSALSRMILGFESEAFFNSILETLHENTDIKIFSERL